MHPIWSGVIGFGLVNIPVRLFSPWKEEALDPDYLHEKDRSPIRYARACRAEEKEIPWNDIVRGFKVGGEYVVLDDVDFQKANARKTKAIDIVHFADEAEVDTVYFEKPYYLEPEPRAAKAYFLLREALAKTGKVGVATFVLRTRENLAIVRPFEDILILNQLRYAHEMAPTDELNAPKRAAVTAKELDIAVELIEKSTAKFRPGAHKDRYLNELRAIIKEKAKGMVPKKRGKEPTPTKVSDLMAALRKSLAEQEKSRTR